MRRTIVAAMAAASLIAVAGCNRQTASNDNAASENAAVPAAADAISGTWKTDLATVAVEQQPDRLLLQNGNYSCDTCVPKVAIPADGAFHPVSGSDYYDSVSVKVVDDKTVDSTRKKGDKVVGEFTRQVSADGNTLTTKFKDSSVPNAPPVTGHYSSRRVNPAPAGAHAISGSWMPEKFENVSDEGLTTTYRLEGDTLHMSSPSGVSFDAKLDGSETPIKGDPGGVTASVKKVSDNSYEETDKRKGKVVSVATMTVGADGKMNVVYQDKERNQTTKYVANKQ